MNLVCVDESERRETTTKKNATKAGQYQEDFYFIILRHTQRVRTRNAMMQLNRTKIEFSSPK